MFGTKEQRYGRFVIGLDAINDAPEVVMAIMGSLIVVRAEAMITKQAIEYEAICDQFDELAAGEETPEYDMAYDPETEELTWTRL